MIKTKIKDGICLIMINTGEDNITCLRLIKEEFAKRNIKIFYASASHFFGSGEKVIIAISENDVYPLLSAMGCIKTIAKISNYSISYSNSLILWEDSGFDVTLKLRDILDKIKLICETSKNGIIICESEYKHKIIANIEIVK